jgi:fused signal recognition particle receptor
MLKFWKKKPAETADQQHADKAAAEAAAAERGAPPLAEAPRQTPSTTEINPAREQLAPPATTHATGPAVESTAPSSPDAAASSKRNWRERLGGNAFSRGLSSLFVRHPKLDDDLLDELETTLITADVGVEASTALVENLRRRMHKREFADAPALLAALRAELIALLKPVERPLDVGGRHPFLVLVVGVNGAGKTTTIGKLARRWRDERRAVMLAAGDTFRAAAVEQLKSWGERNQVPVVSQGQDADAASVIFDALQAARSRGIDVLIADTAGRLHTQGGLMDELGKIARVLKKIDADAPHEVLMVIDGTTGQNAISQLRQFRQIVGVTGLVVTKLDGSAKGGVVFALAREFGLPIRYVGLGETATDLRVFEAQAFVDGLLPANLGREGPSHD